MEEDQITHAGVPVPDRRSNRPRARRRGSPRPFLLRGRSTRTPVRSSISSAMNSSRSLIPPGWMPRWFPVRKQFASRFDDPVDIAAHQIEEFPAHHRDFRLVDPVGAEDGTTTAFGALIEVVEPLLENILGQVPGTGKLAQTFTRHREVAAIDRAQEFGPQDGHVFGIAGTDVKMALIRAGSTPDADVHERAGRNDIFPGALSCPSGSCPSSSGSFQSVVCRLPCPRIGRSK